jgi:hypothetical protein
MLRDQRVHPLRDIKSLLVTRMEVSTATGTHIVLVVNAMPLFGRRAGS